MRKVFVSVMVMVFLLCLAGAWNAKPAAAMDEATQKTLMKIGFSIPGPGCMAGCFYSWYKAGEMAYTEDYIRAVRNGTAKPTGNETCRGLAYLFFKGLSTAPEGIAFYGVGRTLQLLPYDQLDPYSVWTAYGRSYILDATVIGAKAAMPILACYPAASGLPALATKGEIIGNAFLWQAAVGGGWNVVSGTASQALQGAKPFHKYYDQHRWWS